MCPRLVGHTCLAMFLIDWLSDRLIDWVIDRSIDWLSEWVSEWVSNRLIDWLIDWLIEWVSDRLIDWLVDWLCVLPTISISSLLHGYSQIRFVLFFTICVSMMFSTRAERTRIQDFSFGLLSSLKQFVLFSVRLVFRIFFPVAFFGLQITFRLFQTGSFGQLHFFCLPTDFLLFRALVPGLLQRLCFVLRRGFLCRPTDCLLFRALVPGLLQRLCFVLRRGFLCLPTDFLTFTH